MKSPTFRIPAYHDFLSPTFASHLISSARPVAGVPELLELGTGGGLETPDALTFLCALYERLEPTLGKMLAQRSRDRRFIDERVRACHVFNREWGRALPDADYETVLGLEDSAGRIVFGPLSPHYCRKGGKPVADLPIYLRGPHVTLFGPPDSAKMAINAMNAYHRALPDEPAIVGELVSALGASPMWGADDEDSKTPLRSTLVESAKNLSGCFDGTLSFTERVDGAGGVAKQIKLSDNHLSLPIKRFPGLALPSSFLFYKGNPIPLHLYDFALHLFHHQDNPRALVFYAPKIENEEEARYLHLMVETAEAMIRERHSAYVPGIVRLFVVLENPRAILRTHEIMDALHPYFAGASLGWHDYLASTARLFKEDSNYRIPVKADPDIVIKHIKASHRLLADVVGSRGGIKIGGMYGILPTPGDRASLQVTLRGFFKDVLTQMRRDLTGFWVAHPDFVRLGLAITEAWRRHVGGNPEALNRLVREFLDPHYAQEALSFISATEPAETDQDDPAAVRALIVADIQESDFIANNHPDEIRYNVFQSLQYLTDWLCGNGCVALPTVIDGVPVRVMDDLATAERSRWEVWHEIRHGRFSIEDFIRIVHEEMNFIRRGLSDSTKIVQVKWDDRTCKWYPVAFRLMLQLMTAPEPVEFTTELLMPFTVDWIRDSADPWAAMIKADPAKFRLHPVAADFDNYFEICGVSRFAAAMAACAVEDQRLAQSTIMGFSREEILVAASFHGDIGQSRKSLDARAAFEQARVGDSGADLENLRTQAGLYLAKYGFKFLISAQGKSSAELLGALKVRMANDVETEMHNARVALWEISEKRLRKSTGRASWEKLEKIRTRHGITGASIAVNYAGKTQALSLGEAEIGQRPVHAKTWFQLASLSKTVATAFASEYFRALNIPLSTSVNALFVATSSSFRLQGANPAWGDQVTLADLMSHSALNMHYVNGTPRPSRPKPDFSAVQVIAEPGREFHYSGGGFLVLEHLIEAREGRPIGEHTRPFLEASGLRDFSFEHAIHARADHAHGYFDAGEPVAGGALNFPAFAAGASGTSESFAQFLLHLGRAHQSVDGSGPISHDTAIEMLNGADKGCRDFMGCDSGMGVFTVEAGANRFALHQGANDGFRAIYLQCYAGPDAGKGLVVLCNADNRGVSFIAEVVRELLIALGIEGVDFSQSGVGFDFSSLPQDQIVNLGYKKLILNAFLPDLPEPILKRGPLDPLASYNLALGAQILKVSNQKFARAENLLSPHLPVFDPELFERQGKVMDSWESARHNPVACDHLELQLKGASAIRFVSLSTKFHDGNHPEFVRILGRSLATSSKATSASGEPWIELLPKSRLEGHSLLKVDLGPLSPSFSQVRVEIFPDGGLSRLGVFSNLPPEHAAEFMPLDQARCIRFTDAIPQSGKPRTIPFSSTDSTLERAQILDWASAALGGKVLQATNEHYGPAAQVISPFPPIHMFDGMESSRSRDPGHFEEVVLKLGKPVRVGRILLDFTYFVNNNPLFVSAEGLHGTSWSELIQKTRVKAFAGNKKEFLLNNENIISQIRVRVFPDGGINRIRVFEE